MIRENLLPIYRQFVTMWRKSAGRRWISDHLECYLIPREYRRCLGRKEAGMLVRIGIRPLSIQIVSIDDLFIQYRSEWSVHSSAEIGQESKSIPIAESYLSDFLRRFQIIGNKILEDSELKETSFFQTWAAIDKVGFRYDWYDYPSVFQKSYPPEVIRGRAVKLINVYESIKSVGYAREEYVNRLVSALQQPFENTRFGLPHENLGYELWGGHHRAASLAVLGYREIPIVVMKDIRGKGDSP